MYCFISYWGLHKEESKSEIVPCILKQLTHIVGSCMKYHFIGYFLSLSKNA